ncbi:cytochrome C peroxidase [Mucilaginibacter corticis]|uniref:Cytochrome C peroxidase n=1 Tax=Mucilaginibacter corticis TaxID=2597670 RepID=A0A556MLG9_9SPHI|nr:cytochrome c peroxidase [Mucilaginibacter corticis]TSJ40776.1 cytochrome C peroxidase [Mucilaginibacter corticis]
MHSSFKTIALVAFGITGYSLFAFRETTPTQTVQNRLRLQADSFAMAVQDLKRIPVDATHTQQLHSAFIKMRLAYKKIEWAAEYFVPLTTRQVNGPPVPETELNGQVIQPNGLQMIEEELFRRLSSTKKLKVLMAGLADNAVEYQAFFNHADLQDWQILDAVKLEVFRIEALGLNRFDDPLSRNCFNESVVALQSLNQVIANYPGGNKLGPLFLAAISYLKQPVSFDNFNRIVFLTKYANPLTGAITSLHNQLNLPDIHYNRLLNQGAETLFAPNAFNRNAYTASPADSATTDKIMLGKKLFFDPRLSGTMARSCSSCHQPDKAFTDGLTKNLDITGKKFITRNTPTLINAALQAAQFYDLRAASLEDQVRDVVQNKDEMHGDMQVSTQKLWQDTIYRKLFTIVFPARNRSSIDTLEVMNALASYVRSLTALNSRFDQYMQGKREALTTNEVAGFNLFMGKARCSTCHYLPLFNGTLPPRYMQLDAEVIGVPHTKTDKQIDPDQGLYNLSPYSFNRHAFKTTTVRNTALTAPYMHNGVFKTLDEVIDFYNNGGGAGMGIKINNQTLDASPLHLTAKEKKDLVAFIKSLDSK